MNLDIKHDDFLDGNTDWIGLDSLTIPIDIVKQLFDADPSIELIEIDRGGNTVSFRRSID